MRMIKRNDPKGKEEKKQKTLEVELDLSGRFPRGNMLKSGLGGEKDARAVLVENL